MRTRRSSRTPAVDYAPPPEGEKGGGSAPEAEAPRARSSGKRKARGSARKGNTGAAKKGGGGGGASPSAPPAPAAAGVPPAPDPSVFPVGGTGDAYRVAAVDRPDDARAAAWFAALRAALPPAGGGVAGGAGSLRAAVGLDCEWCPPWFRDGRPERVDTIQLYSPLVECSCLVLSVAKWGAEDAAPDLLALLADESIAKVGVNVTGDGSRLARDFGCPVNGLVNLEERRKDKSSRVTLEALCRSVCPKSFHIDKDAAEAQVRLGDWAAWPLTEPQLRYASMDALISFAIFLYQGGGSWATRRDLCSTPGAFEGVAPKSCRPLPPDERKELQRAPAAGGKHSNFFLMHRNRSIVPPNLHKKEHPRGAADALEGAVVVVSGVLDSMSRKDMARYVLAHGGEVRRAVTKRTTHLVNDHGSVGPSKLKQCKAQGIPVVSEDVIFSLVAKSLK